MGEAAKAAASTVLRLGRVRAEVALYKTVKERKRNEEFVVRSPDGNEVRATKTGGGGGGGGSTLLRDALTGELLTGERPPRRGLIIGSRFVDLTDALDDIDARTKLEEMRIVTFIDYRHVPRERVVGSYYLAAHGPGAPRVLALLREAMRASGRVAIVKWTKRTRQALGAITPGKNGTLLVMELAFAEQELEPPVRALAHRAVEVTPEELAAAQALIEQMGGTRATIDALRDDRDVLRQRLIASVHARSRRKEGFDTELPETEDAALVEQLAAVVAGA